MSESLKDKKKRRKKVKNKNFKIFTGNRADDNTILSLIYCFLTFMLYHITEIPITFTEKIESKQCSTIISIKLQRIINVQLINDFFGVFGIFVALLFVKKFISKYK